MLAKAFAMTLFYIPLYPFISLYIHFHPIAGNGNPPQVFSNSRRENLF